jgi:hypothetical protein
MKRSGSLFQILMPDGSPRGGGYHGTDRPKFWKRASHVKNHLKLSSTHRHTPEEVVRNAGVEGAVVVEYGLVEIKRTPVEDFLSGS